ncbi:MAG: MBL fold metallo-hydrolase [Ignavibacteriae bacterium]|nr:MBL fold metallo-hydrolase [Ignavibacteriota bacterium]
MRIGRFDIDAVETCVFGLDGGAMFGVVPKILWSKAYNQGDELNRIPLSARPLLIRFDEKIILVDTGNGTKFNEKFAQIYNIDREQSSIENALQKFNVNFNDITDVILTHLHFDHAGGSTTYRNGKLVPTFPNARYYVQKSHLKWAMNPTDKDKASFIKEDYEPLLIEGMLELLEDNGEIFPGISVHTVFGHTNSMQLVKITDEQQTLLYCADLSPTHAHVNIPFVMGYDNNPLLSIEEKKRIFSRAYEEKWTLIYEHDAFIQASKIIATSKSFTAGESIEITHY